MALEARLRLPLAGPTPATAFLSGSNPKPCHISFSLKPTSTSLSAANAPPPIVVVGSANADIYVEVDRLPLVGETVAASGGHTLAGGKGANQAACGGRLALGAHLGAHYGECYKSDVRFISMANPAFFKANYVVVRMTISCSKDLPCSLREIAILATT
uniref:Carbohydrate kinase PfkB domain-containing protein n=1 Tax=Aegilops tauschii TaxID=37682 RepID=M8CE76_AEGTA